MFRSFNIDHVVGVKELRVVKNFAAHKMVSCVIRLAGKISLCFNVNASVISKICEEIPNTSTFQNLLS